MSADAMAGKTVAVSESYGESGILIRFTDGTNFEMWCRDGEPNWITDEELEARKREDSLMEQLWKGHNECIGLPAEQVAEVGWGGMKRPISSAPMKQSSLEWLMARKDRQ